VKNFDNQSIFGEDMDKSLQNFCGHPVDVSTDCPQGTLFFLLSTSIENIQKQK